MNKLLNKYLNEIIICKLEYVEPSFTMINSKFVKVWFNTDSIELRTNFSPLQQGNKTETKGSI